MIKIPDITTTKDLNYICDMLNWNYVASKKIEHYKNITDDKEIQILGKELIKLHENNYKLLLGLLNWKEKNE